MDMRKYASKRSSLTRFATARSERASSTCSRALWPPNARTRKRLAVHAQRGNNNALIKAWGNDSDDWIGQEIELELGTYKEWKSDPPEDKETVKVHRHLASENLGSTERQRAGEQTIAAELAATPRKNDMDDEIPF